MKAFLTILIALGAVWPALGQLHIGNTNLLGYHTDFQRRPVYGFVGAAGSFSSLSGVTLAPSIGLGHAWQITPRFYLAAEAALRLEVDRFVRTNGVSQARRTRVTTSGLLGGAVFVSTSKHNRDFLKLGLPVIRSRDAFLPASVGVVSFFGRRGEYLAPGRTRGPILDESVRPYLETRYGMLYGAQAVALRIGAEAGLFDVGAGTVFGLRDGNFDREVHYLDDAGFVFIGSLGLLIRRRELARTQVVAEALVPFGQGRGEDSDFARLELGGSLFLRHNASLPTSRLSLSMEGGLDASLRRIDDTGQDIFDATFNLTPRVNAGLRYRLTP